MHKRSCAVYPKKQLTHIEKKENDEERKYCRLKLIQEMSAKAPRLLNNKVLQYLSTDWEEDEKKKLPETLEPMNEWVCLQEKLLRLRYIVHNWEIGPETEFDDKWARRAMLSFSGDELKEAISSHSDWGGLTDVLRATIGLCKSKNRRFDHKLWVEHNVSEMADKLSSMNISGVNFGAFKDDLSYDQAPESVKLQLLKLVGCKVKQKKSYWERGVHHAYVNFTWPEGQNMGNYHIIFDVTTCEVLQKWQHRLSKSNRKEFAVSKGRLIYNDRAEINYKYERKIFQDASKELVKLQMGVLAALKSSELHKVAFIVMEYWGSDMPQQLYRVLRRTN